MLCSNCGHDNPADNRFCGMCGTKLERIAVSQREPVRGTYGDLVRERVGVHQDNPEPMPQQVSQSGEPPLLEFPPAPEAQRRNGDSLDSLPSTSEPVPPRPKREKAVTGPSILNLEVPEAPPPGAEPQTGPPISGPSFLGLADEARYNIDYLLEDEPKESHWRLWLVLIILALFGVMAWLQLRHSGIDVAGLMQRLKQAKLSTTEEQTHPSDVTNENGSSADVAKSPQPTQNAPAQANTAQNNAAAAPAGGTGNPSDQGKAVTPGQPATPESAKSSESTAAPNQSASKPGVTGDTKSNPAPSDVAKQADNTTETPAPASKSAAAADENAPAPDTTTKNQPAAVAKNSPPKKPTASLEDSEAKAARARDAQTAGLVASGEKYLYGRGVSPNCERAISYLQKAADLGNAKGSSHLGAMYATGQCLPMDRVRAYKYFAQALHQDSSNVYFQRNLEMLWNEMTADEKQQALARTPAQ